MPHKTLFLYIATLVYVFLTIQGERSLIFGLANDNQFIFLLYTFLRYLVIPEYKRVPYFWVVCFAFEERKKLLKDVIFVTTKSSSSSLSLQPFFTTIPFTRRNLVGFFYLFCFLLHWHFFPHWKVHAWALPFF